MDHSSSFIQDLLSTATITMAPSKMKAMKVVEKGKAEIQEVPLPELRDTYVLVKVKNVALNPTDW